MFTPNKQQWDLFRLTQQEKMGLRSAADTLGLDLRKARAILKTLKRNFPDLFYVDTERIKMKRTYPAREMCSYLPKVHDKDTKTQF